jgi:glycosyltransferase involved in cell wall biosynthesis
LLCVGDLTVRTAAADIFECALSAAEAAPCQRIRIGWIGDGDLRGVLQAQPLPTSLAQHFYGRLADDEIAQLIAGTDLLCLLDGNRLPVGLADAAGQAELPVIVYFGGRGTEQRSLVDHARWSFKYGDPLSMAAALASALDECPQWIAGAIAAGDQRFGIES